MAAKYQEAGAAATALLAALAASDSDSYEPPAWMSPWLITVLQTTDGFPDDVTFAELTTAVEELTRWRTLIDARQVA